ncbi:hypothetical protein [Mucilaginibacter sp.]|uniref:hypothetical protein n=1 Tax=Mucilaginibacter sp. TaxID=1882438 RepID=UPI0025E803B4|nr:hypothetical protein [Mucilaginibacter sp.]
MRKKFLKIGLFLVPILIIFLLFEWANIQSYYRDEVQTGEIIIKLKKGITNQQRTIELEQVHELGLKMKKEIFIVQSLLTILSIGYNC